MSIAYESTGRSAQKRRTRDALVAATRALITTGVIPTVEEAAEAADVSRTTAYRYFPTKRSLLLAAHPEIGAQSMLPPNPPRDPAERLDAVVDAFTSMIVDTEAQQRTTLRLSLEVSNEERAQLPLRQGRGITWIGEALDVLGEELSDDERHALALAVRATIGVESLVWLVDVAGLTRSEAAQLMRWSAQALLQRALDVAAPPTSARKPTPTTA